MLIFAKKIVHTCIEMRKRNSVVTGPKLTKFLHDVGKFNALLTCSYFNSFLNGSTTSECWFAKNADFVSEIDFHDNIPRAIAKLMQDSSSPSIDLPTVKI